MVVIGEKYVVCFGPPDKYSWLRLCSKQSFWYHLSISETCKDVHFVRHRLINDHAKFLANLEKNNYPNQIDPIRGRTDYISNIKLSINFRVITIYGF